MSENQNLHRARRADKDEFYTQFEDIERELKHYRKHFEGKVVYCNCDDPYVSNFFEYFAKDFENLGLKKLISTSFQNEQPNLFSQHVDGRGLKIVYEGDKDGDGLPSIKETKITKLIGDGDFRSDECIELLKQADIVCTNPPFSLFRKYVGQLIEYNKKFLIIGPDNAITYKEIFPIIKNNNMWLGVKRVKEFEVQKNNDKAYFCNERKKWFQKFGNVGWYTNLTHSKRNEILTLNKEYNEFNKKKYPRYDNYDAIEVSKTKDIPQNWGGVHGSSHFIS